MIMVSIFLFGKFRVMRNLENKLQQMKHTTKSIRPFIGAKNFEISRHFYRDLGFDETRLGDNMSVFKIGETAFYLQNAYVKEWVINTMIFMEVDDVNGYYDELLSLNLSEKHEQVRLKPIQNESWGKEFFLYDPSGNLWHFGEFY